MSEAVDTEAVKAAMIMANAIGQEFGELEFGSVPKDEKGADRMSTKAIDPRTIASTAVKNHPHPTQSQPPQTPPHHNDDGGGVGEFPMPKSIGEMVNDGSPMTNPVPASTPPNQQSSSDLLELRSLLEITVEALQQNTKVLATAIRKIKQLSNNA
jgi:hypothetical protein